MGNKAAGELRRRMRRDPEAQHFNAIKAHVERHVGKVAQVFEMTGDDGGTLSLLHVQTRRPAHHQVIVTSGISNTPMPVPSDMEDFERAELLLALPRDWPVSDGIWRDGDLSWPLRWLEYVGRLPLQFDTWIGWATRFPTAAPRRRSPTRVCGGLSCPALLAGSCLFPAACRFRRHDLLLRSGARLRGRNAAQARQRLRRAREVLRKSRHRLYP